MLKTQLRQKELTIGSWLSFAYPPLCEMMAKAGFDWLVIDMEHTCIDYAQAQTLIQTIDLAGGTPLVRVGANDPLIIKRVLDAGAAGVVVPMINSREDAERAGEAAYYPPRGRRGVGLSRAQQYGLGFEAYRDWADREMIIIVQIEHIDGVRNLETILGADAVDGFIVGPYDLSASLGFPGEFDHPRVKEALAEVERIMRGAAKPGGYHVVMPDSRELERRIAAGYRFIAYGDDMIFFADKLRAEAGVLAGLKG